MESCQRMGFATLGGFSARVLGGFATGVIGPSGLPLAAKESERLRLGPAGSGECMTKELRPRKPAGNAVAVWPVEQHAFGSYRRHRSEELAFLIGLPEACEGRGVNRPPCWPGRCHITMARRNHRGLCLDRDCDISLFLPVLSGRAGLWRFRSGGSAGRTTDK